MKLTDGALKDIWDAIVYGFKWLAMISFPRADEVKDNPVINEPVEPPKTPLPAPQTPTPNKATLENFCLAIRDFEGAPGDRNYRNNNPGNTKFSKVGYAAIYGHVGCDKDNFAIFKDYATGWLYLKNLVLSKVRKNPNQTIAQFMAVYAPVGDDNDPAHYAVYIARRLGVKADYPMRLIV